MSLANIRDVEIQVGHVEVGHVEVRYIKMGYIKVGHVEVGHVERDVRNVPTKASYCSHIDTRGSGMEAIERKVRGM